MKRTTAAAMLLAAALTPLRAVVRLEAPSGAAVEITARSLRPGEMLLASFRPSVEGEEAKVVFLNREYAFVPAGSSGIRIVLIGVDFLTPPGSHKIEAVFHDPSRGRTAVQKFIRLHERTFSRKNIVIDERLVVAPPELEERLERERRISAEVYRSFLPEWLGSGDFIPPLDEEPAPNFGEHRLYNGTPRSRHTGVDISAAAGTPIRASNAGRVALAMDLYYSGKTVIIDHGLNIFSVYCHCSRLDVVEGQTVRRGEIIAAVGSTGRSTGPHLHWSVRARGARVDPLS